MRIEVPQEIINFAVQTALVEVLKASPAFKKSVEDAVLAEVKIQAPGNPRIQTVIQEVRDHLDRYPSLAHDLGLQEVVGKAIFGYLQKSF